MKECMGVGERPAARGVLLRERLAKRGKYCFGLFGFV